jgi:hypothetical protein
MCCNGVNEGFGKEFLVPEQGRFIEMNRPIRRQFSILTLLAISIANIIIVAFAVLLWNDSLPFNPNLKSKVWLGIFIYAIYLVIATEANETVGFLKNPKKFDSYKNTFSGMAEGDAFIKFWIQCYHYVGSGKNKKKVVTHSA